MTELHFYKKGKAVRLTDQAHALLAVKSDDYGVTQKEIASEAILMLVKSEGKDKEMQVMRREIIRLEDKIRDNDFFAYGTFILGAVAGGVLVFAILVGVLWGLS